MSLFLVSWFDQFCVYGGTIALPTLDRNNKD